MLIWNMEKQSVVSVQAASLMVILAVLQGSCICKSDSGRPLTAHHRLPETIQKMEDAVHL